MHRNDKKAPFRAEFQPNKYVKIDRAELKKNQYANIDRANFDMNSQTTAEKQLLFFLKRAAVFGAVATKTLPLWLTVFLLIDVVYSEKVKMESSESVKPNSNIKDCP